MTSDDGDDGALWDAAKLLPVLAMATVFIADVATQRGVSVGVGYVVAVALTLPRLRRGFTLWVSALAAGLAVAALFLKPPGALPLQLVLLNRGLTLIALGVVAGLVVYAQRRLALQRQAEQGQARAERLFKQALEQGPDGVLLVDAAGRVEQANPAAHRIFGYGAGELAGRTIEELVPTQKRQAHVEQRQAWAAYPDGRSMAQGRTVPALKADGVEVLVECTLAATAERGTALVFVRDVTLRRRYEERLNATQRLETIGKLAGGIAHDFNNLLTVVNGGAELLSKRPLDAPSAEEVHHILEAGRRGAELTRQILAFSRRQVIAPRRTDVNALLRGVERMLARVLGEDVQLELRLAPAPWVVEIDPGQFEQVVLNLVVNARDAMPTGGKLEIETSNVTLDEAYARANPEVTAGQYLQLTVSDTGHGMTEEVRVRVFEPFFTTKPAGSGTGLGLATAHGIVKQANGHI